MASASLLQLLDDAIGTPEVNVNLEALRKLLKIVLEHLGLLGPQAEEGGTGTEAGARDTRQPEEPPPGKDELQGTGSGLRPYTEEPQKETAGTEATQSNMGEEIQKIKEALGKTTHLCKDLREEINQMKATQSRMGERIRMIQEARGEGNLQDVSGQPLVPHSQPAPAKPQISDMDKLGQSPGTQSTTPGIQTGTPSAQSGTTGTQPGSQADLPATESITSDLSELQGQMPSLQSLARDLQDEKEKIRQLEEALGKLAVTVAMYEVDGTNQIPLQLESALQEIKQEHEELREEQKTIEATMKHLVTADQLQEQLNELRTMMGSGEQLQEESQEVRPDHSSGTKLVRRLLHHCERLQEQVDSLVSEQVQRPQKTQDEELLKSMQATIVRVEGDCEQLSYVTGSLRDDHRQHQKDIEALFQSLEGLEKKADKEDLLLLKVDKAALGSKVSCAHFDASMERLEDRIHELLRRVLSQEQHWQEAQQWFSDALDSKLDRLELGPFQKQLEETWARTIKHLKDELTVEIDNAAGIKQQLLVPYKCLSCDRHLNMQVPGPHIDALPFLPPLPSSHAARCSTITTEEKAKQDDQRKPVKSELLESQSCTDQDTSSALHKGVLHLSKKPGVTELLGTEDCVESSQEHKPEVAETTQDELGPSTSEEHQPASDLNN